MSRNATFDDFRPGRIQHILNLQRWVILSPENPRGRTVTQEVNDMRCRILQNRLQRGGYEYMTATGRYGGNLEHSYLLLMDEPDALRLARNFEQESILTHRGLVFCNGPIPFPTQPAVGVTEHTADSRPADCWTRIPALDVTFTVELA